MPAAKDCGTKALSAADASWSASQLTLCKVCSLELQGRSMELLMPGVREAPSRRILLLLQISISHSGQVVPPQTFQNLAGMFWQIANYDLSVLEPTYCKCPSAQYCNRMRELEQDPFEMMKPRI